MSKYFIFLQNKYAKINLGFLAICKKKENIFQKNLGLV